MLDQYQLSVCDYIRERASKVCALELSSFGMYTRLRQACPLFVLSLSLSLPLFLAAEVPGAVVSSGAG
jgi:hypothetical protein